MAVLNATIACPHCGHSAREAMPIDRCIFFWQCPACHTVIKPKPGDCCVYCSYADVKCPPVQDDRSCHGAA